MPEFTVRLAERPTDVLVFLAGLDDPESLDCIALMAGEPSTSDQKVRRDCARIDLRLLRQLGFVEIVQTPAGTRFGVTAEGHRVVARGGPTMKTPHQPSSDAQRPTKAPPKPGDIGSAPRCPMCADTRVICTDRPGATSPRPCPRCDPDGQRLTAERDLDRVAGIVALSVPDGTLTEQQVEGVASNVLRAARCLNSPCRAPHCWSEYGTPCGPTAQERGTDA